MPRIEGTLMPPSLKATGVTKKAQTHAAKPYPRNPQIYTHRTVSKPLFLQWTVKELYQIVTLQKYPCLRAVQQTRVGLLTHCSHIEKPAHKDKG
jgi:hypothetical protein